jgi:hypothetical protein
MKLHETKKLHYGEYLYKISTETPLSNIFRLDNRRTNKLYYAKTKIDEYISQSKNKPILINTKFRKIVIETFHIQDARSIYNVLINETDYFIRCGTKKLMIYSNSLSLINKISNRMTGNVEIWRPDDKSLTTLRDQKNVIISNTPTDYPYKITFGTKPGKPELAAWIKKNKDKVLAGPVLMKNLQQSNRWIQGQYIFARDEKIIMLLQMIIGNNITRIDKVIYKEDIDK